MFSKNSYLMAGIAGLVATIGLSGCDGAKAGWQTTTNVNKIEGTSETIAYRTESIDGGGQIETDVTCNAERVNFAFIYLSGKENEANPVGMMWKEYPIGRDGVPVRVRLDNDDVRTVKAVSENINVANVYLLTDKGSLTTIFDQLFSPAPLLRFAESKNMMVELPLSDARKPVIEISRDDPGLKEFISYCKSVGVNEFKYDSQHKAPRCVPGQAYVTAPDMMMFDRNRLFEPMKNRFTGGDKIILKEPLQNEPDTLCLANTEDGGDPVVISTLDVLTPDQAIKAPEKKKVEKAEDKMDPATKAAIEAARKRADEAVKRFQDDEMAGNKKLCHDPNTEKSMREMACRFANETP